VDKSKGHDAEIKKEIDVLLSRINAIEASSTDKQQKSLVTIMKLLLENQKHFVDEFVHIKKALDLLTLQVFKIERSKQGD